MEYNLYKTCAPEQTILRIRDILNKIGLPVIEKVWSNAGENVYSCRICLSGTSIGTNGKGFSKLYALASAYAEFMERLEGGILFSNCCFSKNTLCDQNFHYAPNEIKQNLHEYGRIPEVFKKSEIFSDGSSIYDIWDKSCKQISHELNENLISLPFENLLNQNELVYIPAKLVFSAFGSNGMCAGNNREEALVQGLSEILERLVLKKVFFADTAIPSISNDYLKTHFSQEFCTLESIQTKNNYKYIVKDCTFDNIYPVIALVVIDNKRHSFAVSFGSDPDLRIALQRCISEIYQGDSTLSTKFNNIIKPQSEKEKNRNYNQQLKDNSGKWNPIILHNNKESCPKLTEFSTMDQKLKYLLSVFKKVGCTAIYVRDCTFTDFPAYQIIVPGYSEALVYESSNLNLMFSGMNSEMINNCNLNEFYQFKIDSLEHFTKKNISEIPGLLIKGENFIYRGINIYFVLFLLSNKLNYNEQKFDWYNKFLDTISYHKDYEFYQCFCNCMYLEKQKTEKEEIYKILCLIYNKEFVEHSLLLLENIEKFIDFSEIYKLETEYYLKYKAYLKEQ